MNFDLTCSIVRFNTPFAELEKLFSLLEESELRIQLFIVDNSPSPLEGVVFSEKLATKYIYPNANLGYGKGHNIALGHALGLAPYHLVLNPDILFPAETLVKLYNYMESNKNVGLASPSVYFPNGDRQYLAKLLPSPALSFYRRFLSFKLSWCENLNRKYELREVVGAESFFAPFLSGCFMFLRQEVLEKTGLFDDRFFMYYEDVDLSRRVAAVSDCISVPELKIFHEFHRGSYRSLRLLSYHVRSAIKYFNKWGWLFDRERSRLNRRALEEVAHRR